jgi:carbon-monoxide dehydrogenase small subunit
VTASPWRARSSRAFISPTFLRERLGLTGTHLGLRARRLRRLHVEMDGAPQRSCIASAVACDGAACATVEGMEDDPVAAALREAFTRRARPAMRLLHAGMLVAARDLVLRLPEADEARVREEMSGNLCRCTGYRGIVRAILSVLAARRTV